MDNEFHSSVFRSSVNDQGDGEPMLTDARSNDDRIMEDLQPIEDDTPGAASVEESFTHEMPLADAEPLEMIDDQPPLETLEGFDAIEEVDEDEEELQQPSGAAAVNSLGQLDLGSIDVKNKTARGHYRRESLEDVPDKYRESEWYSDVKGTPEEAEESAPATAREDLFLTLPEKGSLGDVESWDDEPDLANDAERANLEKTLEQTHKAVKVKLSMAERWELEAEAEREGREVEEETPEELAARLKPIEEVTKLEMLPSDLPFFNELEGPVEDLGPDVDIKKVSSEEVEEDEVELPTSGQREQEEPEQLESLNNSEEPVKNPFAGTFANLKA